MKLYFGGSHLPTYRNLIKETGTPWSSLSYLGLRKRTNFNNPWNISKYFPEEHSLFVDSGCQVLNSAKEQKYTNEELREIADHYYGWVAANINEIEIYTEFDALQLGSSYIEQRRDSHRELLFDKFVPVWHPRGTSQSDGMADLHELGERFGKVGIAQTHLNGRDLVLVLNRMASRGIVLHGLAMTKQDIMQAVNWTSVSSTSWVSPQKYGSTFVWSHNQLKSYSKDQKEQARRKERFVIEAAGFDMDKILADDPKELLRLSLWSWSQFVESINGKSRTGVTRSPMKPEEDISENYDESVGGVIEPVKKTLSTVNERDPSQRRVIPLIAFDLNKEKRRNNETGQMEEFDVPTLKTRSQSMRICDTCFLAAKCPMFEENSTCAYDIPITIRTKDQVQALMDTLVEMQAQRVLLMKMAEDMEGGHADPILSSEIDRVMKLLKAKHDMEQEGFSLTINAKQQGQPGIADRLFGQFGDMTKLREIEPVSPEEVVKNFDFDL